MCSKCFRESQGLNDIPKNISAEGKKSTLRAELKLGNVSLQVRHGDMTVENVDVIVNAANSSLEHACKILLILLF